jgi:hypothetical protein
VNRAWELVRLVVVTEVRMYVGAARLLARRTDVPEGAEAVRYVGAVSVLLWAFTIVSAVELVALHLIIPWHGVRIAADVLGIWGLVWCLGMTGCHYVYPHLATPEAFRLRAQRRTDAVTVPWDAVASVRVHERSYDSSRPVQVADDGAVAVVVGSRTSLDLVFSRPLPVAVKGETHEVTEVRVYVDEPRQVAELARSRAGGGARRSS